MTGRSLGVQAIVLCVVLALVVLISVEGYVYPLPGIALPAQPAESELGGRTHAGGIPQPFAGHVSDNSLLSTPEYEAFGAKISTARYTHDAVTGVFTRVPNQDCAEVLNARLIDGDHPIGGATNARGLRLQAPAFTGMVGLSIVNDAVGNGRRIYWTVSAAVSGAQQLLYNNVNTDMNRWQADIGQASDVWQFVDPTVDVAGPNTTPVDLCLAHQTPVGQQAAPPVNPAVAYAASHNAPPFNRNNPALTAFVPGFPVVNPANGLQWTSGTYQNYWANTWRPAQRLAADQAATTTGASFCFRSHPFEEFRYRQRSVWALNSPAPFVSFSRVNGANAVLASQNLPKCQCAGSRLSAYLRHLDVFSAPGPEVDPERKYSKGYPEPETSWNLRKTLFAQRAAQIQKNNRVVCFAEARSNPVPPRNGDYEVNGRGYYDVRPTAASCQTCQAQIQFIYGNQVAGACGDVNLLAAARLAGAAAWGNLNPALQSRSFVALDEQICEETDQVNINHDVTSPPPMAPLVQHNQSPLRSLRRRRSTTASRP